MRAHSPAASLSQPSSLSQRAGDLSPHKGGNLSLQSQPIEVSPQRQHEQSAEKRSKEKQEQEQRKRAPQTEQQSRESGGQAGQSPALQASHFAALLRKASAGADSRHNRSKYEYGRPSAPHLPRPPRARRRQAGPRSAGSPDDVPSYIPEGARGPARISKPGTQTTPKSPAESFGPQQSSNPAEGRGKRAVPTGSPSVDSTLGAQLDLSSPSSSELGREAEKVVSGIRSSELGSEAEKVISRIQGNLQDIVTPELAASKVATSPKSWLTGKILGLSTGAQMSKKVQSAKPASAAQQQPSTPQISTKTKHQQQRPAVQDNAGSVRGAGAGELPAPQAGGASSQRRSTRGAERQASSTPTSILKQLEGTRKRLFTKK